MTNREVVTAFLTAYQRHEAHEMEKLLDPGAVFSDMAYCLLEGKRLRGMWRWFCQKYGDRTEPVSVSEFQIREAEGDRVRADYRVQYAPKRGHLVDYVIHSEFTVRDGLITRQADTASISKWELTRMAAGFPMCLIAAPMLRRVMSKRLDDFLASAP